MILALALLCLPCAERVLEGRVLAPDQKPVAGAEIVLLAPARTRLGQATSGADGRFELRSSAEGKLELFVRAEGCGVRRVPLEAGSGTKALGDLALVGPSWLSGRAAFPDGRPAPDIELWAVPEAVAMLPDALVQCVERALEHELAGEGLFTTKVRTGIDGSFRLAGLREGRYMLRCPRTAVVLEPRSGYYHATTEQIGLAVESPRLRVRALDPQGRELLGARVRLVELNEAGGGRFQPGQIWNETIGGPLACASFDVQPESAYGVRVEAKGFGVHEDLVLLAQKEFEQLQEYRLEPQREPGRVRIGFAAVAGFPPGPCLVDLVSPLTLYPDPEAEPQKLDLKGWLPPLPPGKYLFALRFQDVPGLPNWYLPFETKDVLELAPKQERELDVALRLGGRVDLELSGAKLAEATITVEGLDGQPARGLELLPPGRYRVRASAPRCKDASAEVTLEPGKSTKLALTLQPR